MKLWLKRVSRPNDVKNLKDSVRCYHSENIISSAVYKCKKILRCEYNGVVSIFYNFSFFTAVDLKIMRNSSELPIHIL